MTVRPLIVYRIRIRSDQYQTLALDDPAAFHGQFPEAFHGVEMDQPRGTSIACHVKNRRKPAADFSYLCPGTFVLTEKAEYRTNVVSQALSESCQFISVKVGSEQRWAMNPRVCNALDHARSEIACDSEGRHFLRRAAFHPNRITRNVFKLPETAEHEIYTYTGSPDGRQDAWDGPSEDDEFLLGYEIEQMTGLEFEPIWTHPW
jgi:hypothetical protein